MKNLFWFITIPASMFFALIDFISMREWVIVGINNDTEGYPWGPVNENPWYYATPELYSSVMLTYFILMTVLLSFIIWFMARREKKKTIYVLLACSLLFVAMCINGSIQ
ncbi:MAG TPA: hypothetical protein PLA88_06355 [Bacteroidales bacterium]|nr:hypothetical protein [Bacteroidales bacterium]